MEGRALRDELLGKRGSQRRVLHQAGAACYIARRTLAFVTLRRGLVHFKKPDPWTGEAPRPSVVAGAENYYLRDADVDHPADDVVVKASARGQIGERLAPRESAQDGQPKRPTKRSAEAPEHRSGKDVDEHTGP